LAIYDYDFTTVGQIALKIYKEKDIKEMLLLNVYMSYFNAKNE
jgi:hypothetical protein